MQRPERDESSSAPSDAAAQHVAGNGDRPNAANALPPNSTSSTEATPATTPPARECPITRASGRTLAETLAPSLATAADGLGPVTWFKADWQRGGAATGNASFDAAHGARDVVVKLPVNQRELNWMRRLQVDGDGSAPVVPELFASGTELGGYDLAWLVMERFRFGPLGRHWHDDHVSRIAAAATRFHSAALAYPVTQPPRVEPWPEILEESVESVRLNAIPDDVKWRRVLKTARGCIDGLVAQWRERDVAQWLHGDLHFANAMSRDSMDHGPVSLIDLAEIHAGHWIEDAVYLERQLWSRPDLIKATKPVRSIARERKKLGLPVERDYNRLATLRRTLLALSAPKFIKSEGHPRHLAACLEWAERGLAELATR